MQENNTESLRLIDEALLLEPIRNTFRLGWEFIILNPKFTLTAIMLFIGLHFIALIPALSLIFIMLAAVFSLSVQMYVGKTFYTAPTIENYIHTIKESKVEYDLSSFGAPAFGAYLGGMIIMIGSVFIFILVLQSMGLISPTMTGVDLINVFVSLSLPLFLTFLLLFYIQPLVQANIILSNTFKEGFKAIFTLFSLSLWRSAFQYSYFNYMIRFGISIIAAAFIGMSILIFIREMIGFAIIESILTLLLMYLLMIMFSIGSMMARRIVENNQSHYRD